MTGFDAGGAVDTFVSKFDTNGNRLWREKVGAFGDELAIDVSADGLGNVYITGSTERSLEGINAGLADAFISKYGRQR